MKTLIVSMTSILLGVAMLVIPGFITYIDTSSLFFDLSRFLSDHPGFTIPIGIVFITFGIVYLFLYFCDLNRDKTVFVVQKSDDDYGDVDLHFPKIIIGNKEELIYENLLSLSIYNQTVVDLEKKKMSRFYNRIPKDKKLAFLAISPMPTLVYAGFVVGNSGRKVAYYHWNRKEAKAKRIWCFGNNLSLIKEEDNNIKSKNYVICISTSYLIDKRVVKNQFSKYRIINYKSNVIGADVIRSKKALDNIADSIRAIIAEVPLGSNVHLLLSCSSELCFAIGQRLNSPALPKIYCYNFDGKNTNSWNWKIDIN